ncbi:MAG: hypothetical protein MH252_19605 [Thermosynechococcaceae cyanobacterium MS004]|nr:hypothetical protein [Thermosynechococcaceae cyanobacterium MS004]
MLLKDSPLQEIEEDGNDRNPPLIEWMKEYAEEAGPKILLPTLEEIKQAVKDEFPELYASDLDLDHLLEALGIHVIADYREFKIAWFGTTDGATVDELLSKFQDQKYSRVRKKLCIDHLWVLNLQPDLGYSRNDIFEALVDFSEIDEKPECVIIDL